jgi:hypothetical protein
VGGRVRSQPAAESKLVIQRVMLSTPRVAVRRSGGAGRSLDTNPANRRHQMFSIEIRNTFAALAVALTVALAPGVLAPAAHGQIFRPDLMQQKKKICDNYKTLYDGAIEGAVQIDGNPDGQNQSDADAAASDQAANQTRENARKAGCGWAA